MDSLFPSSAKRVGYWITERKYKRLDFGLFEILCRSKGIQLIKLNLEEDLEKQGPFDLILHKVSDMATNLTDIRTAKCLERFQEYVLRHPEVVVVDPLERVLALLHRNLQYQFTQQCNLLEGGGGDFFVPSFIEFNTKDCALNRELIKMNNISFPIVCKSSLAAHHSKTQVLESFHDPDEMMIIFDENGLRDIVPPCVVQSFINHNARLYKVFVVGNRHFIIERPSIKNFYQHQNQRTIFFKSSDISKSSSSSVLNKLDKGDIQRNSMIEVEERKIDQLIRSLGSRFLLDLYGVDVVIENITGRYAVIDVNPFPGYDGVREFLNCLVDLIDRRITESRSLSLQISYASSLSSLSPSNGDNSDVSSSSLSSSPQTPPSSSNN